MSGQFILLGLVIILVCTVLCVLTYRLIFRKNILFKISIAVLPSHMALVILGFLAGTIQSLVHFTWLVPVALVFISVTYFWLSRIIQLPLQNMSKHITSLSEGNVDSQYNGLSDKGENEIAQMSRSLVRLTISLRNVAFIAKEIGEGNLNVNYDLLGENDVLGNSLITMQNNLVQAETEKEVRHEEDERRNWVTRGIADFSELLRNNTGNVKVLCESVITSLVRYIRANQGGIFILNEDDPGHAYLEMMACYAYDRRKFADKNIEPGEGLVGMCYLEKETIYITQVPKGYIHITSGLGEDDPRALLIVPLKLNDIIYGVIEIATFNPFEAHEIEFIEKVAESIASTISMVKVNTRTNQLLEASKLQAEEMAGQEEELRQNLEELQATQEELGRKQKEAEIANTQLNKEKSEIKRQLDIINMLFPCIVLSDNLSIISANPSLVGMLHVEEPMLVGKNLGDFLSSDKEQVETLLKSEVLKGEVINGLFSFNMPSGVQKICYRACPIINDNQVVDQIALLCIITE